MPSQIHAYIYLLRPSEVQFVTGLSQQAQLIRNKEFLREMNIPIKGIFREAPASHLKAGETELPKLQEALEAARKSGGFILVRMFPKDLTACPAYEGFVNAGGLVIGTVAGFGEREPEIRDRIAKAVALSQRIGDGTRDGHRKARQAGSRFGNPRLREAGLRGVAANSARAAERYQEFLTMRKRAESENARSAQEIVDLFNRWGFPTPTRCEWTTKNFSRASMQAKAMSLRNGIGDLLSEPSIKEQSLPPAKEAVVPQESALPQIAAHVDDIAEAIEDDASWDEFFRSIGSAQSQGGNQIEITVHSAACIAMRDEVEAHGF